MIQDITILGLVVARKSGADPIEEFSEKGS